MAGIINGATNSKVGQRTYRNYTPGEYNESDRLKDLNSKSDYWGSQDLQNFTWDDSMLSAGTQDWLNMLNTQQRPEWGGYSRQGEWDSVINNITNMKDFTYDVNGDALYHQYKDQYTTQGKMAMMDTMGQAAALTGGYGNSYAQSVGQQTFQGYMQQLTDKIPELYQLALSKYNSDKEDLYRQNDLHQNLFNNEYGMYQSDLNQYNTDRNYYADQYNTGYDRDFNAALAENESYNSNITSNRNYFLDASNSLANQEWGQYVDNENLAAQAINIYNENVANQNSEALQREQFQWQKDQSNLQDQIDAMTDEYVVDNSKARSVAEGIMSREDFEGYANSSVNFNRAPGDFNLFTTSYVIDGVTYDSYEEYVDDMISLAYDDGRGFNTATAKYLREYFDL